MAVYLEKVRNSSPVRWVQQSAFIRNNASVLLIYFFILVLIVIGSTYSDRFLTAPNLINIMRQSFVLGLIAIGQTAVLLTGGMDISQEMIARLVGLTVATIFAANESNPGLIFPLLGLGIAMGAALGWFNGFLITRTHAVPFIITFGMAYILRGVNFAISNLPISCIPSEYIKIYDDASIVLDFIDLKIPINIIAMLLIWYLVWIFTTRARLGRNIYAVGGSQRIAQLSGIRIRKTVIWAYIFSSVFAALGGLFLLARSGVGDPSAAEGLTFKAIVAAAIGGISLYGGRGSIWGTLGGVLLLTLLAIVLIAVASYKTKRLGAL